MSAPVPWRYVLWFSLLLVSLILLFLALLQLTIVSIPFLLALGVSTLVEPLLLSWESRGGKRSIGITLTFALLSLILILIVLIIPSLLEKQILLLKTHAPQFLQEMEKEFSLFLRSLEGKIPGFSSQHLLEKIRDMMSQMGEKALVLLPTFTSHLLFTLILTPVFTFFILRDRRRVRQNLLKLVPNRQFEMVFHVVHRVEEATERYIRGVLLEAVIVGLISFSLLYLMGVRSSGILGILMILANLIPYLGSIAISIGGTLYLLLLGAPFSEAILVVVAVGIAHLCDNTLVAPLVLGNAVKIHPIIVLLLLVLGGTLLGVLGLVIIVPLGAVVYILIQECWQILQHYTLRRPG